MNGINALAVTWEAEYDDGVVLREAQGGLYRQIQRNRLRVFRLVSPGEVLLELFAGDGRTGQNLVYRRRTLMGQGAGNTVWFIAGWVPSGPVFSLNPETLQLLQAPRLSGGAGPLGLVQPIPAEGELWTNDELLHTSDARMANERIVLPTGMVLPIVSRR